MEKIGYDDYPDVEEACNPVSHRMLRIGKDEVIKRLENKDEKFTIK